MAEAGALTIKEFWADKMQAEPKVKPDVFCSAIEATFPDLALSSDRLAKLARVLCATHSRIGEGIAQSMLAVAGPLEASLEVLMRVLVSETGEPIAEFVGITPREQSVRLLRSPGDYLFRWSMRHQSFVLTYLNASKGLVANRPFTWQADKSGFVLEDGRVCADLNEVVKAFKSCQRPYDAVVFEAEAKEEAAKRDQAQGSEAYLALGGDFGMTDGSIGV